MRRKEFEREVRARGWTFCDYTDAILIDSGRLVVRYDEDRPLKSVLDLAQTRADEYWSRTTALREDRELRKRLSVLEDRMATVSSLLGVVYD